MPCEKVRRAQPLSTITQSSTDLAHNSSRLHETLAAGEWPSSQFKEYLDKEVLEDAVVMKAHDSEEFSS